MTCTRNEVTQAFVAWCDTALRDAFTEGSGATRDLSMDPSGRPRRATPALWLIESGSRLFQDNQYWSDMEVDATLVVSIKAHADHRGLIQDLINDAEAALDEMLRTTFTTDSGVPYTVRPAGDRPCYPGTTGEGQLEYPVKLRFTRQEVMG